MRVVVQYASTERWRSESSGPQTSIPCSHAVSEPLLEKEARREHQVVVVCMQMGRSNLLAGAKRYC